MSTDGLPQFVRAADSEPHNQLDHPHLRNSAEIPDPSAGINHWRNGVKITVIAGIVAGAVLIWTEILRDRFIPKRWGVVVPGQVYRSGQLSAALIKRVLEKHNIQVIIDLNGPDPNWPDQVAEKQAAAELGIQRTHYMLPGNGIGDIAVYAEAIRAIVMAKRDNQPVLVHCAAGAQRTGGVIAAYRMLVCGVSPQVARDEMMRHGWDPISDKQLTGFLNRNMLALAELLVEMGVLSEMPEQVPQMS